MHVKRKLSLALEAFLLWRDLVVSLDHDTLRKQLFLSSRTTNFLKGGLGLVHKTSSESAKSNLNQCSVEEDLAVDIESVDSFLQMRHQHHITSLVVVVVQS